MNTDNGFSDEIKTLLSSAETALSEFVYELNSLNKKLHRDNIKLEAEKVSLTNRNSELSSQLMKSQEVLRNQPPFININLKNPDESPKKSHSE